MLRFLRLVGLCVLCASCATLRHADGTLDVPAIIEDGRFGLLEACSVEWVPADACTFGLDAFSIAQASNLQDGEVAARRSLVDAESKLASDSRLRPYLDVVIVLLPAK